MKSSGEESKETCSELMKDVFFPFLSDEEFESLNEGYVLENPDSL